MKKDAEVLLNITKQHYINLKNKYNFNHINENDVDEICVRVKNIIENLRSVYDYIANDVSKLYPSKNAKIYFPYAKPPKSKLDFESNVNKLFPNIDSTILNAIMSLQYFNNETISLYNLFEINNTNKHIELYTLKIQKTPITTLSNQNDSLIIEGNLSAQRHKNHLLIGGTGRIYSTGHASIYANGDVQVGAGIYNVIDKTSSNLDVEYKEKKGIRFVNTKTDIITELNNVFSETQKFIQEIKKVL